MIDIYELRKIMAGAEFLRLSQQELDSKAVDFINCLMSAELSLEAGPKLRGKRVPIIEVFFKQDDARFGNPLVGRVWRLAMNRDTRETDIWLSSMSDDGKMCFRYVPLSRIENPCNILDYIQTCVEQGVISPRGMFRAKNLSQLVSSSNYMNESKRHINSDAVEFIDKLFEIQGSLENTPSLKGNIIDFPNVIFSEDEFFTTSIGKVCGMAFNHETHETDIKVVFILDGKIIYKWVPVSQIMNPCKVLEYVKRGVEQGRIETN